MTKQTLDSAVAEARRFIERAEAISWRDGHGNPATWDYVQTAACKRASLDLTRALARMRKV